MSSRMSSHAARHQARRKIRYQARHQARHQAGLSLVELMIGMVLGLIIIAAIYNIYAANIRSSRFNDGLQVMQENGRHGLSVLQTGFRMAGYSPTVDRTSAGFDAIDIDNSSETTIVVQMEQPFDCNGADTSGVDGIAINTYTHDAANQQITCQGNVGQVAMPLVDGVEEFRILYGIDRNGNSDTSAPQEYVPYDAALDSDSVRAVRFAMLVNSGQPIRSRDIDETFVVLDKEVNRSDRLAREVFASTVLLRNQ